jgi:GNAT superfamily N-acetyltransferase
LDAAIRPLHSADLAAAQRLSESAHWNQNQRDWAMLLQRGQGWGIDATDALGRPQLAASVVVLPYGEAFAWTSMVLVLPQFRRRGFAQRLLRQALAHLSAQGRSAVLDATPAGHAVYVQEGFVDTWGFARYRREALAVSALENAATAAPASEKDAAGAAPAVPDSAARPARVAPDGTIMTRPLQSADWPALGALDAPAFGASRLALLQFLARRLPQCAWVAERDGVPCGYVLGRDGREAHQLGPLLAAEDRMAIALLQRALAPLRGPVYIDLLDRCRSWLPWLQQQGFALQRPFTRMVHGAAAAPGDPTAIVLAAGPELG